jgi:hypothetical protein
MKLKSFSYLVGLIIIFFNSLLFSEEKVDIWKNNKETSNEIKQIDEKITQETSNPPSSIRIKGCGQNSNSRRFFNSIRRAKSLRYLRSSKL